MVQLARQVGAPPAKSRARLVIFPSLPACAYRRVFFCLCIHTFFAVPCSLAQQ